MTTNQSSKGLTVLRSLFSSHRADGSDQLARELATFSSPSELNDLNAILARHDDAVTAEIRDLVDWTRAA